MCPCILSRCSQRGLNICLVYSAIPQWLRHSGFSLWMQLCVLTMNVRYRFLWNEFYYIPRLRAWIWFIKKSFSKAGCSLGCRTFMWSGMLLCITYIDHIWNIYYANGPFIYWALWRHHFCALKLTSHFSTPWDFDIIRHCVNLLKLCKDEDGQPARLLSIFRCTYRPFLKKTVKNAPIYFLRRATYLKGGSAVPPDGFFFSVNTFAIARSAGEGRTLRTIWIKSLRSALSTSIATLQRNWYTGLDHLCTSVLLQFFDDDGH